MSWFYGVHLLDKKLEAALELIRFIAEPDFLRRPHITIRGPYERKQDATLEKLHYTDKEIRIIKVDTFYSDNQNTLFLECAIPDKERVWRKPNFPDGSPHITLYDGPSREMAWSIRAALKECKWKIKTQVSDLSLIQKKRDPKENFSLIYDHVASVYKSTMFEELELSHIRNLDNLDRMFCISRVGLFISKNFPPHGGRKSVARA
jgi:hypothetical protein